MNRSLVIMEEDCAEVLKDKSIPWDLLRNRTVMITGATGLIGQTVVQCLLYANRHMDLNLRVLSLVRDLHKARKLLGEDPALHFVLGDIMMLPDIPGMVDYIIHGASITDSASFIRRPVQVMQIASIGIMNMLELANAKHVSGFVYLSSMEVYGNPPKGKSICEKDVSGFIPEYIRNSYPISKQYCEALCCAYHSQYSVPAKVLRLTQTFGPGVDYKDKRVFAEFMRCAVEKKDIVLKTHGETERCYLYTADAATAILTVLLKGNGGECYTAANPATYCSISEMAQMVATQLAEGTIKVRYEIDPTNSAGYANTLYMMLDITKIKSLGWAPHFTLYDMYKRMMEALLPDE